MYVYVNTYLYKFWFVYIYIYIVSLSRNLFSLKRKVNTWWHGRYGYECPCWCQEQMRLESSWRNPSRYGSPSPIYIILNTNTFTKKLNPILETKNKQRVLMRDVWKNLCVFTSSMDERIYGTTFADIVFLCFLGILMYELDGMMMFFGNVRFEDRVWCMLYG